MGKIFKVKESHKKCNFKKGRKGFDGLKKILSWKKIENFNSKKFYEKIYQNFEEKIRKRREKKFYISWQWGRQLSAFECASGTNGRSTP